MASEVIKRMACFTDNRDRLSGNNNYTCIDWTISDETYESI